VAQHIPTPEEIAYRLKLADAGKILPPVQSEVDKLADQVAGLERQVKKKRTAAELRQALDLLMEKYDFSPAEQLIQLVMEKKDPDDPESEFRMEERLRVHILETLLEYTMPKLKSVEMSGTVEHNHSVVVVRYGEDGKVGRETLDKIKDAGPQRVLEAEVVT
jgi:hypothetical protein